MSEENIDRRGAGTGGDCIRSEDELRQLHAPTSDLVKKKCVARLDKHCRDFIALSRIATEKGAAIDSFYVSESDGRKLRNDTMARLQKSLQHAAESTAPL